MGWVPVGLKKPQILDIRKVTQDNLLCDLAELCVGPPTALRSSVTSLYNWVPKNSIRFTILWAGRVPPGSQGQGSAWADWGCERAAMGAAFSCPAYSLPCSLPPQMPIARLLCARL